MTPTLANTPASWTERAAAACPLEAVGWTEQGQADRFRAVLGALNPQPFQRLLDFGCGTGALTEHLDASVDYLGVDSAAGMVRRAKSDHPGFSFRQTRPAQMFHLVACVGTFNLPGGGWTKGKTWETLRSLWVVCTDAMAVSLYAGTDERCLRYEPGQVLSFAASSNAARWRVERHRSNDLLLVLYR